MTALRTDNTQPQVSRPGALQPEMDELKKLAEAATLGPWKMERHDDEDGEITFEVWNTTAETYCRVLTISERDNERGKTNAKRNAAFIAAANPQTVLKLIASISTARADGAREMQERAAEIADNEAIGCCNTDGQHATRACCVRRIGEAIRNLELP